MALKLTRSLGMTLLAVYLILVGLSGLIHIAFAIPLLSIFALLAGVFLMIGR